jgi:hypothetical protein
MDHFMRPQRGLSKLQISLKLERNELGRPQSDVFNGIIDNYLFLLVEKPLRDIAFEIRYNLFEYTQLLSKAEMAVSDISKELIMKA